MKPFKPAVVISSTPFDVVNGPPNTEPVEPSSFAAETEIVAALFT